MTPPAPLRRREALVLALVLVWVIAAGTELVGRHQLHTKLEAKYKELAESVFRQADASTGGTNAVVLTPEIAKIRRARDQLEILMANGARSSTGMQSSIRGFC